MYSLHGASRAARIEQWSLSGNVRDDGDSALRIVGIFYELCALLLQWLQFYGNLDRELVKCIPIGTVTRLTALSYGSEFRHDPDGTRNPE